MGDELKNPKALKRWPGTVIKPVKKPAFLDDDVEWLEGWTLYIKNAELALRMYNAMYRDINFRIVVDGNVVVSIPKDTPGSHRATDVVVWSSKDMDWDEAGCLVVKDNKLKDHVVTAHANNDFYIVVDEADIIEPSASGDPGGEGKINAMCPC